MCLSVQQLPQAFRRTAQTYIKRPEERVHRAHFIEPHLVDQLLEDHRLVGEQGDTPFPIVKADGAGDDLLYFSRVAAANEAVLIHLPLAFFEWECVPVLVLAATAVHGIEADVAVRGHLRKEPRLHGLALARECVFDGPLPLIGMRFYSSFE